MTIHCLASKYGQLPSTILSGSAMNYTVDVRVLEAGLAAEADARQRAETDAVHRGARGGQR